MLAELTFLEAMFASIFPVFFLYYFSWIANLCMGEFETKRHALISLIPLYGLIDLFLRNWKKLR